MTECGWCEVKGNLIVPLKRGRKPLSFLYSRPKEDRGEKIKTSIGPEYVKDSRLAKERQINLLHPPPQCQ